MKSEVSLCSLSPRGNWKDANTHTVNYTCKGFYRIDPRLDVPSGYFQNALWFSTASFSERDDEFLHFLFSSFPEQKENSKLLTT